MAESIRRIIGVVLVFRTSVSRPEPALRLAVVLVPMLALAGCASLIRPAASGFAEDLSTAVLDQDDVAIVRDAAPAYLVALDGLIEGDSENTELLLTGARLYGTYTSAFVTEEARQRRLWERALTYARRALCRQTPGVCEATNRPLDELSGRLVGAKVADVPALYGFGVAWAGWVQARSQDWRAIAQLPKIEALMRRVVELDESHDGGAAHLYLGVLLTQRPASLGGRPDEARWHFERTVALSHGLNLMAKVLEARHYARLVFDRRLHDRLLGEVLQANPKAPGLTLTNTLAQDEARRLLADADDYF